MSIVKLIIISGSLLLSTTYATGQTMVFQHAYGGVGQETCYDIETYNDGYVLAGHTTTFGAGAYDYSLTVTDSNGYPLWTRTYGGSGWDIAKSVDVTKDNGFVLNGNSKSFIGINQILVIKTDSVGNLEWGKTYEDGWGYDISQTSDKGYILTGYFDFNKTDMFLLKLDSIGNTEWAWIYGDSLIDIGRKVLQTQDGGYLVSGYAQNSAGGKEVAFLIKTTNTGVPIWSKKYVPTAQSYANYGYALAEIEGGYVASSIGYSDVYNSGGSADIQIFRIDSMGNVIWSKIYGGTVYDDSRDMFVNEDNSIVVVGATNNWTNGKTDFLIMKVDQDGDLLWSHSFGGSSHDEALAVAKDNSNNYVIAGYSLTYGSGQNDMFFAKLNTSGLAGCNDNTFSINSADFTLVEENTTSYSSISITTVDVTLILSVDSTPLFLDTICNTTINSVEITSKGEVLFYPNPSNGQFTIEINSTFKGMAELKIINLLGEEIYSESISIINNSYQQRLDISIYAKGIYFLNLSTSEGILSQKIVVQ